MRDVSRGSKKSLTFVVCGISGLYSWRIDELAHRKTDVIERRRSCKWKNNRKLWQRSAFNCSNFKSTSGRKKIPMPCYNHVSITRWLLARSCLESIIHACSLKKDVRRYKKVPFVIPAEYTGLHREPGLPFSSGIYFRWEIGGDDWLLFDFILVIRCNWKLKSEIIPTSKSW